MSLPEVVPYEDWVVARRALLAEEKALTRRRDELSARRRAAADGRGRQAVRLQRPRRRGVAARPLRGPPPARRRALHVRPRLGGRLPELHGGRRRARRRGCSSTCTPATRRTRWCRARRSTKIERYKARRGWTSRGSPRAAATSTTTSTSPSTSASRPSSTTSATPSSGGRPLGLEPARCRERAASCATATACSTRTRLRARRRSGPAAPTTGSTSRRWGARRTGRSRRPGRGRPRRARTSRPDARAQSGAGAGAASGPRRSRARPRGRRAIRASVSATLSPAPARSKQQVDARVGRRAGPRPRRG